MPPNCQAGIHDKSLGITIGPIRIFAASSGHRLGAVAGRVHSPDTPFKLHYASGVLLQNDPSSCGCWLIIAAGLASPGSGP